MKELTKRIKRLKLKLEELETILMPKAIRYDIDRVQHEPVNNLEDLTIRISELRTKIRKLQGDLLKAMDETVEAFDALADQAREVMYCRYIRLLSQSETAMYTGYTKRHVQRLEREAKKKLSSNVVFTSTAADDSM